jgi:hypothetical protein
MLIAGWNQTLAGISLTSLGFNLISKRSDHKVEKIDVKAFVW